MKVLVPDVNKKLSCFRTEFVKEYAVILVILECKYLLNGNYVLNELSSRCTIGIEVEPSDLALFFVHIETVIAEAILIQTQNLFAVGGQDLSDLLVGVALNIAGFIVPPTGEISDSVLWVLAQALIYAGGVFGVKSYIDGKVEDLRTKLKNKNNEDNK